MFLVLWYMLFATIAGHFMKSYGADTLFLAPEYFNQVSIASTAITGFAEYTYSSEKYAKDIGLVNKEMMLIKKDLAIGGGKRRGFALKMNCIAYE